MTTTSTSATSSTHGSASSVRARSARVTAACGLLAGSALVVDTLTITVVNGSFGILDDLMFLVGFAGLWLTVVALAVRVAAGPAGASRSTRIGVGVGTFLAVGAVLGAVSWAMDRLGRNVFSDANVGLHGEWSFFSIGLCLLAIAAWARRRA